MSEEERSRELAYLETLTTLQSRADIENGRVIYQKQNLVFSPFLYENTKQIVQSRQETRGIILSNQQTTGDKKFFLALYMQILGMGDEVSVYVDPDKKKAIMELLQRHPELKAVEFHSHTTETGKIWEQRFSPGDYNSIHQMRKKNPDYTHVLFTPTHILTNGREKTSFVLARSGADQTPHEENYERFDTEYRSILERIKQ